MITRQSTLFGNVRKEAPADADSISHKLLARAAYVDQLASGIFSLLPLGWRVHRKIEEIVRAEMVALGAQEVLLPSLQPASLWAESGRLDTMDPPLFRTTDRHERELVLASTHEEVITDLARKHISSYKDLPLAAFQIHTKFRNEVRATGGLLRVREFAMKDLYSFHQDSDDLAAYYERVKQAYLNIFARCDLTAIAALAGSGDMGGSTSHEFSVESPTGEDHVTTCTNCDYAVNAAGQAGLDACPQCSSLLTIKTCIENGHIFQLGTKYAASLGARYTTADGTTELLHMGCYGIGIGRLLATIAETHHDEAGLIWPASVSPFAFHVLPLQESVRSAAEEIATRLALTHDILFDDRPVSAGQKFAEADLLGIATRVVISTKTQAAGKVEVGERATGKSRLVDPSEL